jgi:predicted alpha/beta-hydrolase family hydrolase
MLFIQGSNDTFGNEQELRELMPRLQRATLHVITGGDHSFKVRGGAAAVEAAFQEAITAAVRWMTEAPHTSR